MPLTAGTGSSQGGLSVLVDGHEDDPDTLNNHVTYNFEVRQIADVHVDVAPVQAIDRAPLTP